MSNPEQPEKNEHEVFGLCAVIYFLTNKLRDNNSMEQVTELLKNAMGYGGMVGLGYKEVLGSDPNLKNELEQIRLWLAYEANEAGKALSKEHKLTEGKITLPPATGKH